jgi:hypothetical protein
LPAVGETVFQVRIFDTPVKVNVKVLPLIILVWGGVTWLGLHWHPERGFWQGLFIGLGSLIFLAIADFGHALAHIFSARRSGAPMDELLISGEMPRTLYQNNDVAPNVHRMRALGGPIFNLAALLLSMAIFQMAPRDSIVREWMGWSSAGHAWILVLSLLPLPMVDGGTLLKWTLVARGKTETEADEFLRRIDRTVGIVGIIAGAGFIFMKNWIAGLICVAAGVVVLAIAGGRIR